MRTLRGFDGNTATNSITYTLTNREFMFVDFRAPAAGGSVRIRNNTATMPSAGSQQLIKFRSRQTNTHTVNLSITNNTISGNATGLPFVDIDSEAAAQVNATISTSNIFPNAGAATTVSGGAETAGTSFLCLNVTGNTLNAAGTIGIDQTGTLRVPQASAAAIATANGIPSGNVTVTGAPAFSQPVCPVP